MTQQAVEMSMKNRTGIGMSPIDSQQMIDASEHAQPSSPGDASALAAFDSQYIREAEPVGSVPVPGTVKGAAQTMLNKLGGKNPEVLIDKLGERLAFERTGTRLYDYLIAKCEATQADGGISIDTLRHFRKEEALHFKLAANALESLGADPTAQTPGADVIAVASSGVLQVLSDPRTSVPQCLEAMLSAELTDNAGWELLFKLAGEMKLHDLEKEFRQALVEEEDHLKHIRHWHEQSAFQQAGLAAA
jgi:ferritin-like protein